MSSPSNNDESINGWMWFQECLPTRSRDWLGGKAEVTQALESGRSFHQSQAQRRLRMTRTWQERYRVSSNYTTSIFNEGSKPSWRHQTRVDTGEWR